ncbi:MAG: MarP family serine protease [Actinobacteria bacterium]|nr:MarP family serine protease [Actinomycetota bacterium]
MTLLDLVLLVLVGMAVVNGFRRGAVLQLFAYAGLLLGLLAGALLAPRVAGILEAPPSQAALALLTLLSLAAAGGALGRLVGRSLSLVARATPLAVIDSLAGSVVSLLATLLAIWFVGLNLVNGPIPQVSAAIGDSAVIRAMDARLPHPPPVLAQARQFLDRFGFPQVFAGLPPAPVGPVQAPAQGDALRAGQAADQSTVRIVGAACGSVLEGSGFVASAGYVVTNAHVVAGVTAPMVQEQNGGSRPAVPVLFDARLDVAVLFVQGLPTPALPLRDEDVARGTGGAVLGYPGGGSLRIAGAAVRSERRAVGRDIYGRSIALRDVYELQTVVRPGNSGGPFALPSGEVAGVVFAASTLDPAVGYAVTSPQLVPLVERSRGRRSAVSTGPCVR